MRVADTGAANPAASIDDDILTAARTGADDLAIRAPKLDTALALGPDRFSRSA